MKWIVLITGIIVFLPLYSYVMSKSITLGRLTAFKQMMKHDSEDDNGKEEK